MAKTVVNSWNEWDPLKHVIVGRADDCHIPPEEPALFGPAHPPSGVRENSDALLALLFQEGATQLSATRAAQMVFIWPFQATR